MRVVRAVRPAFAMAVLCMACGVWAAIALAAPAGASRRRPSHAARACHRHTRHRHCPPARAGKRSHRKDKPRTTSTPSTSTSGANGSSTATPTTSSTPAGSTPISGTLTTIPVGEAPPGESPTPPAAPARVEVTAEDTEGFRFVLSRPTVPAGKVIIEFVNHGQDEHNLHAVEQADGSEAGSLPNTAPNAHPSLSVTLRNGSYTLFCSLPGHEAKGMKATLVVN
jgi:plastocyanin